MAVDQSAVGATDIGDLVLAVDQTQLGVAARDLRIVKSECVGRLTSNPVELLVKVKLLALIGAMNDDEPRHKNPRDARNESNDTDLMPPRYPRVSQRSRDLEGKGSRRSDGRWGGMKWHVHGFAWACFVWEAGGVGAQVGGRAAA